MSRTGPISIALAALLSFLLAAAPVMAIDFTEREISRLKEGKAVKKPLAKAGTNGFYGGSGYALIDAPPEVVWKALLDWDSYPNVYPKTVKVKEISRREGRSLVKMELGHEMLSVSYFVEVKVDKSRWQIDYRLVTDKPHDIDAAHGYWRLFPQQGGRTLVAYVVAVQVPMGVVNLIPESLERKINRNLLASPRYLREWLGR